MLSHLTLCGTTAATPLLSLQLSFAADRLKSVESPQFVTISPAQCRMARAGLGLSVSEASKVSLVSRATITRFESGREIKPVLRSALQAAFERLGAVFTDHGVDIVGGRGGKGI
jgi:hypothetical protein